LKGYGSANDAEFEHEFLLLQTTMSLGFPYAPRNDFNSLRFQSITP